MSALTGGDKVRVTGPDIEGHVNGVVSSVGYGSDVINVFGSSFFTSTLEGRGMTITKVEPTTHQLMNRLKPGSIIRHCDSSNYLKQSDGLWYAFVSAYPNGIATGGAPTVNFTLRRKSLVVLHEA